jgi:hypothetical protein
MPLFKSRNQETLESAGEKLVAARDQLAAAQAEVTARSVDAVSQDSPGEYLAPFITKVQGLQAIVSALETAERELHRRERQRKAEAQAVAEKARINAVKQHTVTATKIAKELSDGLGKANKAWAELIRAVGKAELLLRGPERDQLFGRTQNTLALLAALVIAEGARINGMAEGQSRFPLVPKHMNFAGTRHGVHVSEIAPLEQVIAHRLDLAGLLLSPAFEQYLATYRPASPVPFEPPLPAYVHDGVAGFAAPAPIAREPTELPAAVKEAADIVRDPASHTPEEISAAMTAIESFT